MNTFLQDLRVAARGLQRTPLYSAAALLALALGIGATTAIYSVVSATMLQPLPYASAERLMDLTLTLTRKEDPAPQPFVWSYPKFTTMRESQRSFAAVAAYATMDMNLTGDGGAQRVRTEMVSGPYFDILRAPVARGRALQVSDDTDGSAPVVVLSHALWVGRFGGDSSAVGREIEINRYRMTVVGVGAPGFKALSGAVDLWVPIARASQLYYPQALQERWAHWIDAVGRLRDGVTPEVARTEMRNLGPQIEAAHPGPSPDGNAWGAAGSTLREARNDPQLRRAILVLFGAVCCVLLIACVNVANLLLARAAGRQREFAVRIAIGAKRGQLIRQLLTETLLLSLIGGLLGVTLAAWALDGLRAMEPGAFGGASTQAAQFLDVAGVTLNANVLAFSIAMSLITGLACGVFPALRASRPNLSDSLKDGSGASSEGMLSLRRGRARALLISGDVALSFLLLVGAGLLARSFAVARGVDAGFRPEHVLTFRVQPPEDSAFSGAAASLYKEQLLARLAAMPGVEAAAVNYCTPLSQACNGTIVLGLDGIKGASPGTDPEIGVHSVNPGYLHAIGAHMVQGRFFTDADRRGAPIVVVISEAAAKRFFPGQNAVGRRISVGIGLFRDDAYGEIIGVVSDVNYRAVGDPPQPELYTSYLQYTGGRGLYLLRTRGDPSAVAGAARSEIRAFNAELPIFDVMTLEARVSQALARLRFGAVLLGAFAALGLILAVVGIYGVLAYSVSQRTRELGIRIALGAMRGEVIGLVMRRAMALASLGLAVGLLASWAASRLLRGLVFGISTTDPLTFGTLAVLVALICAAASYFPARRASRLDPVRALRTE